MVDTYSSSIRHICLICLNFMSLGANYSNYLGAVLVKDRIIILFPISIIVQIDNC